MKDSLPIMVALAAGIGASCTCTPPETVDEPATALVVKVSFIDVDETPSDGKQPVVVQFFRQGKFVQLAGNASITCNNVPLRWNGLGYAERVPLVPPGGMYTVSHVRTGMIARMTIAVPPRPAITTPAPGSIATRSTSFSILYPPGGGTSVRPGVSGPGGSLTGPAQPDNGTATVDASGVGAGEGSVSLARDLSGTVAGTGFADATFVYTIGHRQRVVWQ